MKGKTLEEKGVTIDDAIDIPMVETPVGKGYVAENATVQRNSKKQ